MPTKFTRTAGRFAFAASGLWLASLGLYWLGQSVADDWDTGLYLVWSACVLVAGGLTFVATLGLRRRGATSGVLATVGLVILGVGVVVSIVSWAIPAWMTIQGVGMLLVTLAIWPKAVAPRLAVAAYGSGMLIGVILYGVLTASEAGTPDKYGDYPLAWETGLVVGLVIVAAGLLGIGRRLHGEEPADVDSSEVIAA